MTQGTSSATSLGLSLLAGRALGASGLGVVFAGFTGYVMLLALHRALVSTPLISRSSRLDGDERLTATRTAFTVTLCAGVACTVLAAVIGLGLGGPIGHGLLAFAPWMIPAFAQELFRSSLFRDDHGRRGAITDLAWLATMIACVPAAAAIDEVWAVVAAWGLGATIAALIGARWLRAVPMSLSVARRWFVDEAFPFGRWLALQEGSFVLGYYGLIVILTEIVGVSGIGGFRAADSIFSPFTFLAPALLLVGLPTISRALGQSRATAVSLAMRVSSGTIILTLVYASIMLAAGRSILVTIYGQSFEPYGDLVVPLSVVQLLLAAGCGFTILLRAEQRGRPLLVAGATSILVSLVSSTALAAMIGVVGAAWGLAVGAGIGSLIMIFFSLQGPRVGLSRLPSPQPSTLGR